jgi:hypothetical protein
MPRSLLVPDVASSRPVGVALALTMAVGLLSGCSFARTERSAASTRARPTATSSPTLTTAPTPSPTTTPKPERPAAMDTVNLNGAIATAEYFLELFPYALNTGDINDWDALSHPDCQFCSGLSAEVKRQAAVLQHQEGLATSIATATGIEVDPGIWFTVELDMTQGKSRIVDAAGAVLQEGPQQRSRVTMIVIRESNRWLVRGAQIDPWNG